MFKFLRNPNFLKIYFINKNQYFIFNNYIINKTKRTYNLEKENF